MGTTPNSGATASMTSHKQRWLTGIVLTPALSVFVGYAPPAVFACFIGILAFLTAHEYGKIVLGKGAWGEKVLLFGVTPPIIAAFYYANFLVVTAVVAVTAMLAFALGVLRGERDQGVLAPRTPFVVFGVIYIPLFLAHVIGLRAQGVAWVFFAITFPMAGDIAAFYVGKKWGRRKLAPRISPNKSVAGLVAIPCGALIGGGAFAYFFLPEVPFYHVVVITVGASLWGQMGDLCESMLKRAAGVKDSGTILPGHGGLLDRIDCLLFVFPLIYYYKVLVIG